MLGKEGFEGEGGGGMMVGGGVVWWWGGGGGMVGRGAVGRGEGGLDCVKWMAKHFNVGVVKVVEEAPKVVEEAPKYMS